MRPPRVSMSAVLAATLCVAGGCVLPSAASAVSLTRNGGVLTATVNNNNDDVRLSVNGSNYEFTGPAGTQSYPRAGIETIVVDGNLQSEVAVVLDGESAALEVPAGIEVKNLPGGTVGQIPVPRNNAIELKGTIRVTGVSSSDSVVSLGASVVAPGTGAPITLVGATDISLAAPAVATSSRVELGGPVDGAYALTVQQPGGLDRARMLEFQADVGASTPLASLSVAAGSVQLPGVVETAGTQAWADTELWVPDADATLHGSRVTGTGAIGCQLPASACIGTPDVTIDVSEVRTGGNPGSSIGGVGSTQYGQSGAPEQQVTLVKEGAGTLSFDAAGFRNRHSGGTTVSAGTLRVGTAGALGTGVTDVAAGATLEMTGVDMQGAYTPLGFGLRGTITSTGGPNTLRVPVTVHDDATITATTELDLTSYMAGGGNDLTVSGPVDLLGLVDTTGAVRVAGGTAWTTNTGLATSGTLVVDGDLDITPTGTPPFSTALEAARITGAGAIRCGLVGAGNCGQVVARVTDVSAIPAFAGGFGGGSGLLGNIGVTKAGPGTLALSGTSTISGNTVVQAGELRVTGSIGSGLSAGSVTVEAGARLSGSGSVGGGDFIGGSGLSVAGTIDLDAPSGPEAMTTARLDLIGGALDVAVDAGGSHSQLQVSNGVSLVAGPVLNVRAGAGITDGATAVVVRTTSGGPISGAFRGMPEGALLAPASGPGAFRISYSGGDGDDIALTYVAPAPPPAPAAGGAATGGAAAPARGGAGGVAPRVRAARARLVGTSLVGSVSVPGPGRITQLGTLAGSRRGTPACHARRAVPAAGTYRVSCALGAGARAARARGAVRITIATTFTPLTGGASTTRSALTLGRAR